MLTWSMSIITGLFKLLTGGLVVYEPQSPATEITSAGLSADSRYDQLYVLAPFNPPGLKNIGNLLDWLSM